MIFPKKLAVIAVASMAFFTLSNAGNAMSISSLADNFNDETTELNSADFLNWNVTNGSVDTIGPGSYPGLCETGQGNCVDLDGSSNNAGDLSTINNFEVGDYKLTFDLSGNQRTATSDGVLITFGDLSQTFTTADVGGQFGRLTGIELFATLTIEAVLSFSHAGGDNVGLLLDNVLVERLDVAAVPIPAALPLFGTGVAIMGFLGWRRKRKAA